MARMNHEKDPHREPKVPRTLVEGFEPLHAFVRLVDGGSFTGVGRELGVSQSTVSRWVGDLEQQLGVALLDRTTRVVRPTHAGLRFHDRCLRLLADFEEAVVEASNSSQALAGPIVVSVPVVLGEHHVLGALDSFTRRYPNIELRILASDSYDHLIEKGIDLAVRLGPSPDPSLVVRTIARIPRRLVAAPSYLEASGQPATPEELGDHECLVHTGEGPRVHWHFRRERGLDPEDGCEKEAEPETASVYVRGPISATHSGMTRTLVRSGRGIALLASWLVDDDVAQGSLVQLLPQWSPPKAPLCLLTPPGRRPPLRVRRLADELASALQCLGDRAPGDEGA